MHRQLHEVDEYHGCRLKAGTRCLDEETRRDVSGGVDDTHEVT